MSRLVNSHALMLSLCCVFFGSLPAFAGKIGVGRPALPSEVAAWNKDVRADGMGLPPGTGTALDGEVIFEEKCAACHGDFGEGIGRWPILAGGIGTLLAERPVKTPGSYWPYLSTLWDYTYRTMPFGEARTLSADETYALVAYILLLNDLVDSENFELTQENLAGFPMPNVTGFRFDDREKTERPIFKDTCMRNCKTHVEITKRAGKVDVTPTDADN